MSFERGNIVHHSLIDVGNYKLSVKTYEHIYVGFEYFYGLETNVSIVDYIGRKPPVEEFAKKHAVILYSEDKSFKDRDALYTSAKEFHEEQIENIKNMPIDKLKIYIQFAVKDRLDVLERPFIPQ